jgi:hypothetical protein
MNRAMLTEEELDFACAWLDRLFEANQRLRIYNPQSLFRLFKELLKTQVA